MKSKQLKVGIVLSYVSIALTFVCGILYTPWMIRQIGQDQYAIYTLSNSLIGFFLVDFGLSFATSKFVSRYRANNDEHGVADFLGAIYKLYLIIDLFVFLVFAVVFLFIDKIYVNISPENISILRIVFLISGLFSIFNFPFVTLNGILNAYEQFFWLKLIDIIYRLLYVSTMIIVLLLGQGIYALVTVNAIAGLITTLLKLIVVKKKTTARVNLRIKNKNLFKEIFLFSFWVTIATLAQRLIFNITPSILGIVSDTKNIAIFGIIVTIEGYAYTITSAINGMFMPRITQLYGYSQNSGEINNLLIKVGKFQGYLNGLILIGFFFVGRDFIVFWLDNSYISAYYGIILVLIPGFFHNPLQIANTALVVRDKVKIQAVIYVGMGVINILLSFVLSSFFGAIGAAFSIFIAYSIRTISLIIVYNSVLKLDMKRFFRSCYIRLILCGAITFVFILPIQLFFNVHSIFGMVLLALTVIIVFTISTFFVGLSEEEKKLVINRVKKRTGHI